MFEARHLQDEPHGTQEFEAPPVEVPQGKIAQHIVVHLPDRGEGLAAVAGAQGALYLKALHPYNFVSAQ